MTLQVRALTQEEETTIESQVHARTLPAWKMTQAKIIWYARQGEKVPEIARRLDLCEKTTRMWLKRFNDLGMKGLEELPRAGRPPVYPAEQVAVVIQTLFTAAPSASVVVCLDELGPESVKRYQGRDLVQTEPTPSNPAGRAKQEIDYGRRGPLAMSLERCRLSPARS
ncbi:MAG TPA: helix-turn-helix domain-containing protein [Ktedonobacteraceae bacterium]|nr:helix-turn-helix domain-containing protein [Ktedonobacteraceae bacterium]